MTRQHHAIVTQGRFQTDPHIRADSGESGYNECFNGTLCHEILNTERFHEYQTSANGHQ